MRAALPVAFLGLLGCTTAAVGPPADPALSLAPRQAPAPRAAPAVSEAPAEAFHRALVDAIAEDADSRLRMDVEPGSSRPVRIGELLSYRLGAGRDVHLLVVQVDSHGTVTVLAPSPLAPASRISADADLHIRRVPATAPTGPAAVYAIATRSPLDLAALGLDRGAEVPRLDREAGIRLARGIAEQVRAQPDRRAALVTADLRIVGGDVIEYTVEEVVRQLTPTRSIQRPLIDFHLVRFAFDSSVLTAQARRNLDVLGRALQAGPLSGERFIVGGHTDDVGAAGYNVALSRRRAAAARSYLVDAWNIPADRITTRGYGESRPLESSATAEARAMNRRVEFGVDR